MQVVILMQYPELAYDIVKAVVEAVNVPVTVKMRIGYDMKHINCVENGTINGKKQVQVQWLFMVVHVHRCMKVMQIGHGLKSKKQSVFQLLGMVMSEHRRCEKE